MHLLNLARRVVPAVVAVVLAVGPAGVAGAARTGANHPTGASITTAPGEAELLLESVTPRVAAPGQDVTLQITVHNTTEAVASPTVEVTAGPMLRTRDEVSAHADAPSSQGDVVTSLEVPGLAPGARTSVALVLPADELTLPRPYGALPLTVSVTGLSDAAPLATFLPFQVVKEYEPLRLAAALPLTADPDPDVLSGSESERVEAWRSMVAPGSRVDRVVDAAEASGATLVVDPQLLGPIEGDDPPDADDPRSALDARVNRLTDVWALPPGDPDLSALAAVDGLPPELFTSTPQATPRPVVAWPAGSSGERVREAVPREGAGAPAAMVVDPPAGEAGSGTAVRRDDDGHRVLVVDRSLSALLTDARSAATGALLGQQALADSVALLAESPGRARATLVLPGRDLDPDPAAVDDVLQALADAPWITPVDAQALLEADPSAQPVGDGGSTSRPSPLTRENAEDVARSVDLAAGLRPVFPSAVIPSDLESTLVSTRWRGHVQEWNTAHETLRTRLGELTQGVYVIPSTINFFAEHGALQVTVVNDLDVEVENVRLSTTVQGRPSRLVVRSEPDPLTIRPHSRATVRFEVEALAAGLVPITTSLRTPDGVALGDDATVDVQVQPTNGWVLLAAAVVVGGVFVFGLLRTIRFGRRRVSDTDLRDLDLS